MNEFEHDWKDVATDNKAFGFGGSLIYKTAPFARLSATAGFYYSDSQFSGLREDNADIAIVKGGKDTFSRYDVYKTSIKAGRQIFESFLTSSNDTKIFQTLLKVIR